MHRELGGSSFAELGLPEGLGRDAELEALLDATRIEAQASTKRLDSEQGPTDPDARFGRDVYGYQLHISSDFATGLICNAALTPGNVNETTVADALLLGGEQFVPADRAYDTRERRALYEEREIEYLILQRGNRHHPLSEAERERNRALAKLRRRAEAVFGTFKRSYGYRTVRYFNLARNTVEL